MSESPTAPAKDAAPFIQRWSQADGSERQNYQLFLTELCTLLDLPQPEPASQRLEDNTYVFERKVIFHHADGTESRGFIDLYKRGCFVLEAKKTEQTLGSQVWGNAMLRAHGQAQQYARALPAAVWSRDCRVHSVRVPSSPVLNSWTNVRSLSCLRNQP